MRLTKAPISVALGLTVALSVQQTCDAQVIYTFTRSLSGVYPQAPVLIDSSGSLYGTTEYGGPKNGGTVFKLTPPAAGQNQWMLTNIYGFGNGAIGFGPYETLTMDSSGALYGVNESGAYKLSPPVPGGMSWIPTFLASLSQASSPLLAGPGGSLYGTSQSEVYQLKPPAPGQSDWTKITLYQFSEFADGGYASGALIMDREGNLYGTAGEGGTATSLCSNGCGVAYKLSPPTDGQTAWTIKVLYRFAGGTDGSYPVSGMVGGPGGVLYGTTVYGGDASQSYAGDGTVFKLTPPSVESGSWTESVIQRLAGSPSDGSFPNSVVLTPQGNLVGTTLKGGAAAPTLCGRSSGCGTIFELSPPTGGSTVWTRARLELAGRSSGVDPNGVTMGRDGTFFVATSDLGPIPGANGTIVKFGGPTGK